MNQGLSNGGGVNTAGVTLGLYERGESIAFNLFADTGGEKRATYKHIERLDSWCVSHGLPGITVVRAEKETLEEECLRTETLPSIVVGIRSCSDKFKIRPQTKWLEANGFEKSITRIVGFDSGEGWRVTSDSRWQLRFPLIEWQWFREDCVEIIKRHGLEVPPKSSCFFCPEMKEWEILQLQQTDPDKLERALAMERNNTKLVTIKGLARDYSWQQVVDFHRDQMTLCTLLPERTDHTPCVCFDGEA